MRGWPPPSSPKHEREHYVLIVLRNFFPEPLPPKTSHHALSVFPSRNWRFSLAFFLGGFASFIRVFALRSFCSSPDPPIFNFCFSSTGYVSVIYLFFASAAPHKTGLLRGDLFPLIFFFPARNSRVRSIPRLFFFKNPLPPQNVPTIQEFSRYLLSPSPVRKEPTKDIFIIPLIFFFRFPEVVVALRQTVLGSSVPPR